MKKKIISLLDSLCVRIPSLWKLRNILFYGRININTQEYWEKKWEDIQILQNANKYTNLFDKILSFMNDGDRVLDLGTGNGMLLYYLKKNGIKFDRLTGLDFSVAAIETLKKNGIEGFTSTLPNIPFKPNDFSVIICTETIEHLTNPHNTIIAINKLNPEKVILSVPNNYLHPAIEHDHVNNWNLEQFSKFTSKYLGAYSLIFGEEVFEKGHMEKAANYVFKGGGHILLYFKRKK